jgi:hypothetical protein
MLHSIWENHSRVLIDGLSGVLGGVANVLTFYPFDNIMMRQQNYSKSATAVKSPGKFYFFLRLKTKNLVLVIKEHSMVNFIPLNPKKTFKSITKS